MARPARLLAGIVTRLGVHCYFSPVVVALSLDGRELITATTLAKETARRQYRPYYAGAARLEEAQAPRLLRSEDPLQVADLAAAMCLQPGSLVQGVVCAGHVPWRQS
jgi:hypothetical protein